MEASFFERLFEPWPHWSTGRTVGKVFRFVIGLVGAATGGMIVFLAYFGATFKKTPAEWTPELTMLAGVGVMALVASVAWSIRPSRLTAMGVAAAIAAPGFIGPLA